MELYEELLQKEIDEITDLLIKMESKKSPNYYYQNGVDCLDVISDVLDFWQAKGDDAFYLGNVIKYVMRAPYKNDFGGDIDKAIDYLNKLKDNRVHGVHFDFGDILED